MASPYSQDLRDRVLAAYDRGEKTKRIAKAFSVSPAWARRLKQRRRETGETSPRPMGRRNGHQDRPGPSRRAGEAAARRHPQRAPRAVGPRASARGCGDPRQPVEPQGRKGSKDHRIARGAAGVPPALQPRPQPHRDDLPEAQATAPFARLPDPRRPLDRHAVRPRPDHANRRRQLLPPLRLHATKGVRPL